MFRIVTIFTELWEISGRETTR